MELAMIKIIKEEFWFWFLLGVITYILTACGSAKSTTSERTHATQTDSAASYYAAYDLSRLDWVRLIESNSSRNVTLRRYDTSKPADPVTGLPPVLADVTVNETNETKATEHLQTVDSAKVTAGAVSISSAELEQDKQSRKDITEPTQIKQFGGAVWALVALGVVVIIGLIVYKWKSGKKPP